MTTSVWALKTELRAEKGWLRATTRSTGLESTVFTVACADHDIESGGVE